MPLIIAALGLLVLLVLIMAVRMNAFIAFIIVSIAIGIAQRMALGKIILSILTTPVAYQVR
jgi:Gnt-I system high-affinity gluconate transporter